MIRDLQARGKVGVSSRSFTQQPFLNPRREALVLIQYPSNTPPSLKRTHSPLSSPIFRQGKKAHISTSSTPMLKTAASRGKTTQFQKPKGPRNAAPTCHDDAKISSRGFSLSLIEKQSNQPVGRRLHRPSAVLPPSHDKNSRICRCSLCLWLPE